MSFEAVIYNRIKTGAGNYMDGRFAGAGSAFTSYSEDIGVGANVSQEMWKLSSRVKKKGFIYRISGRRQA